jgi:hypothetical protein
MNSPHPKEKRSTRTSLTQPIARPAPVELGGTTGTSGFGHLGRFVLTNKVLTVTHVEVSIANP